MIAEAGLAALWLAAGLAALQLALTTLMLRAPDQAGQAIAAMRKVSIVQVGSPGTELEFAL